MPLSIVEDFDDLQRSQGTQLGEAVEVAAVARSKAIALTGLVAMTGALFILDDPIFNGLLIFLVLASWSRPYSAWW